MLFDSNISDSHFGDFHNRDGEHNDLGFLDSLSFLHSHLGEPGSPQNFRQEYLHGSSERERQRLSEQGELFGKEIHTNLNFQNVKHLLEIGSGSGVQTMRLLMNPKYHQMFVHCVDLDEKQLNAAKDKLNKLALADRAELIHSDARDIKQLADNSCDAAFVCFALEHIPEPERALREIKRILSPGSRIVFREVNNQSLQIWPADACPHTLQYWEAMGAYQREALSGDPNIGFRLKKLLQEEGFHVIKDLPKEFKEHSTQNMEMFHKLAHFLFDFMENGSPMGFQLRTLLRDNELGMFADGPKNKLGYSVRSNARISRLVEFVRDLTAEKSEFGNELKTVLQDNGFSTLTDRPREHVLRYLNSPQLFRDLVKFWQDLMEGANDLLVANEYVDTDHIERVRDELKAFKYHPDAIFKISYQQVQALVP
ncbi:MAG: class I SAM-dependent methyltransferase [Bdellovibrionales bacterium]|nr:class I SAM-dependent methyltransferase [Bdellovibrionales bacterium]